MVAADARGLTIRVGAIVAHAAAMAADNVAEANLKLVVPESAEAAVASAAEVNLKMKDRSLFRIPLQAFQKTCVLN